MESGDKYSILEFDTIRTSVSLAQLNSPDENISLLHQLNIPLNCLDNSQIRQHYIEEYSAKYSKAKYLLSNARKKQRKIIMTYYDEKEKQENFDRLQIIKESLLEENEKIKKFKEALKTKLILYQQRIQFLKDAEFWSTMFIEQLQNNSSQTNQICTEMYENQHLCSSSSDLPMINDSLHLLHDHVPMNYSE
ncbi:hypothetical protein I4U23_006670 [Adineta vaga]|nr:hypothetical protein I4U23_006670 [Adineta vaga]